MSKTRYLDSFLCALLAYLFGTKNSFTYWQIRNDKKMYIIKWQPPHIGVPRGVGVKYNSPPTTYAFQDRKKIDLSEVSSTSGSTWRSSRKVCAMLSLHALSFHLSWSQSTKVSPQSICTLAPDPDLIRFLLWCTWKFFHESSTKNRNTLLDTCWYFFLYVWGVATWCSYSKSWTCSKDLAIHF